MHDRVADPTRGASRATRRRRVATAVLGVVTAAGLGVSTVQFVEARRDERTATAAAAVADATADALARHLHKARDTLARAERELGAADERLSAGLDDLYARLGDRHALTTEVETLRAALANLHLAIDGTESEAQATAALVRALGTCLDGVTELLNQVSVGDDAGAARTVDAIGPSCAAVGTVLG